MENLQELSQNIQIPKETITEDIPCSKDGLKVSEEEYWAKYYEESDFVYEWNNGYLEEKPVSDYSGYLMYDWFNMTLKCFLMAHPIAKIVGLEFGFRLPLPRKVTIRKPDLAVVLNNNPSVLHLKDRTYAGIFDLCIEAVSDSTLQEIKRDTVVKKGEYETIGVSEYYLLDPKARETAFYRYNEQGRYEHIIPESDDIIRSEILPGFRFRISDLYQQPSLMDMTEDTLYSGFILPFYQAEKQKTASLEKKLSLEKQRAEQEKQRAEKEKQRADRLEAKLREMGISLE